MRKLLQDALLSAYRTRFSQRFVRSALGRRIFEITYLRYKSWVEAPNVSLLQSYVSQGGWAIDVGANIGFFTVKFARWVDASAYVIAIEPEDVNYGLLSARLQRKKLTNRVLLQRGAATDIDGPARLSVRPEHPGDHRLSSHGEIEISGWRIDTLLEKAGLPQVGFVKIDVQGAEMQVLRGATETFQRCRPVLFIEIDDGALKSFNSSPEEVVQWLLARHYSFHSLENGKMLVIPPDEVPARVRDSAAGYLDILARPEQLDSVHVST